MNETCVQRSISHVYVNNLSLQFDQITEPYSIDIFLIKSICLLQSFFDIWIWIRIWNEREKCQWDWLNIDIEIFNERKTSSFIGKKFSFWSMLIKGEEEWIWKMVLSRAWLHPVEKTCFFVSVESSPFLSPSLLFEQKTSRLVYLQCTVICDSSEMICHNY